jgi:hypothetical protein
VITLEVKDRAGATSTSYITVTVLEKSDSEDYTNLLITSISGIIIVIILIIILFVLLKKKREAKEKEKEPGGELPEYPPPTPAMVPEPLTTPSDQAEPYIQQEIVPPTAPAEPAPSLEYTTMPPEGVSEVSTASALAIPPSHEPGLPVQPVAMDFGGAYIILTKGPEFGLSVFEEHLIQTNGHGLLVIREHPSTLKTRPIMDTVIKIWLSKTPDTDSISPGNITKIAHVISEFVKANERSIVLLDGLEYLINNNDFSRILKFLELLHEVVVLNNGILMVPVNPMTLSKTDFELLENELTNIIKDPAYSAEVMP